LMPLTDGAKDTRYGNTQDNIGEENPC
jgi:hypothetical protein